MKAMARKDRERGNDLNVIPIKSLSNVSRDLSKIKETERRQTERTADTSTEIEYEQRCKKLTELLRQYDKKSLTQTELSIQFPREFNSWRNMKYDRVPKCGSKVHPDFERFPNFLRFMGPKPSPAHTLDRINNQNPEYSPENCHWASKVEQSANRSNTNILTDKSGQACTVREWSVKTGTPTSTIRNRLSKGWPEHDCIHGRSRASRINQSPDVAEVYEEFRRWYANQGRVFVASHDVRKRLANIAEFLRGENIPAGLGVKTLLYGWGQFRRVLIEDFAMWENKIPELPHPRFIDEQLSAVVGFVLETLRNQVLGNRDHYAKSQCRKDEEFCFNAKVIRKINSGQLTNTGCRSLLAPWLNDPEVIEAFWAHFKRTNPESEFYEKRNQIPIGYFSDWLAAQLRDELRQLLKERMTEYDSWRPRRSEPSVNLSSQLFESRSGETE